VPRVLPLISSLRLTLALASMAVSQQPNPVVRKVDNPVTDTPYVNPLQQDQPVRPPAGKLPAVQPGDELSVSYARLTVSGPKENRVSVYEGAVDGRIGTYRLQ